MHMQATQRGGSCLIEEIWCGEKNVYLNEL